jgi:hypothetical protein
LGLANRARRLTLLARPTPTQSNRDHRDLVEAIRDGLADKAEALHREHRRKHGQLLVSILRDIGLKSRAATRAQNEMDLRFPLPWGEGGAKRRVRG